MFSTPRLPEVKDFPRCNIADTDWHVRMPTDHPPDDPKVEILAGLCKEKDATLEQPFLSYVIGFHIEISQYICWNKWNKQYYAF